MIPVILFDALFLMSKPRASGDDPTLNMLLDLTSR